MRLTQTKLFCLIFYVIVAEVAGHSQNRADPLQQLVEISAQRLSLAKQVALAKWDSGMPVEDMMREEQVIADVRSRGANMGLDIGDVSGFFQAQIEANKLVQYSLLAQWHRAGKAPVHKPVSLDDTTRRALGELETPLLAGLAKTRDLRASPSCDAKVAKEVGKYVSAHKDKLTQVEAIALDRAMGQTCGLPKPLAH